MPSDGTATIKIGSQLLSKIEFSSAALCKEPSYEKLNMGRHASRLVQSDLASCGTSHNHSFFRKSSSESEARNRPTLVSGSLSFASAFSFIARLACVY